MGAATAAKKKDQTLVEGWIEETQARLDTLAAELAQPLAEKQELEDALARLTGKGGTKSSTRRGRPRGGKRADEFLKLVSEQPGITVGEAAKTMSVQPNYLYRVAGTLVADQKVVKEGTGYVIASTPSDPEPQAD